MPAEHPSIMQGQHHWDSIADQRKGPQIEVSAMEIVTVQHLRALRNEIQELPSPWEIEILDASPPVEKKTRLAEKVEHTPQSPGSADLFCER